MFLFFRKPQKLWILDDTNKFLIVDLSNPNKCFDELYAWGRSICLRWNAINYNDKKYCDAIPEEERMKFCYSLLAVFSRENNYCENSQDKEDCNLEIEAINKNQPNICEKANNPRNCYGYVSLVLKEWNLCSLGSNYAQCYLNIIQKNNDLSQCERINGQNWFCYAYYSIKNKNSSLCEESNDKPDCYYTAALGLLNSSLCSQTIGNDEDLCLGHISILQAKLKGDPSECEKVGSWKGNYYDDMALLKDDPKICKLSDWESNCLNLLAIKRNATIRKFK